MRVQVSKSEEICWAGWQVEDSCAHLDHVRADPCIISGLTLFVKTQPQLWCRPQVSLYNSLQEFEKV